MMALSATTTDIRRAYAVCEEIARRDKPHLYAAAQHFTHRATRHAFAAAYASMRIIDDFIDEIPDRPGLSETDRQTAARHVDRWLKHVRRAIAGRPSSGPVWVALADTFSRFPFCIDPWQDLAGAMIADLSTPAFTDWDHLRRYMRGASVAPAIVFMQLVLMRPVEGEEKFCCAWDYSRVVSATEDLAVFCYWVHILRDVASDLSLGGSGLVYIPQADLAAFGLSAKDLHRMREQRKASPSYVNLARSLAERARFHLENGRKQLPEITAVVTDDHRRALSFLVDTYVALLKNLATHDFDVFAGSLELNRR